MSKGLDRIRERMTQYLRDRGVEAMNAWPQGERARRDTPAAVVSLRRCQAGPSGFQDYLGQRFNEETLRWEDLFGRKAELTFGLDLYVRAQAGEQALQACFDQVLDALQAGGPEGLTVLETACGETEYRPEERLLVRTAQVKCSACLYAVTEPGGLFLDFEIRGGIKQ